MSVLLGPVVEGDRQEPLWMADLDLQGKRLIVPVEEVIAPPLYDELLGVVVGIFPVPVRVGADVNRP